MQNLKKRIRTLPATAVLAATLFPVPMGMASTAQPAPSAPAAATAHKS